MRVPNNKQNIIIKQWVLKMKKKHIKCLFSIYIKLSVCVCVSLYIIYFPGYFKKFLCHRIEKLPGSVLVKTELKYLL